jgi:hypothetical protein
MEGISKERLEQYIEVAHLSGDTGYVNAAKDLLQLCTELNPWLPIESAPKDRHILLFYPEHKVPGGHLEPYIASMKYNELATIMYQPTHWQELPGEPK